MAANLEVLVGVQDRELQRLRKDIRTLSRDMSGVSTTARTTSRSFDSLNRSSSRTNRTLLQSTRGALAGSGAFRLLGRQIAFASGAFLGAAGFTAIVTNTIKAASDLNEEIDKTRKVFGDQAAAVIAWSRTTSTAMGLSQRASLSAAGAIGNMLTTIGLVPKESAPMSRALVKLGSDMASFSNEDPTEMLERLRSGLAGEAEPLRRFGVLLSEARVKQEAVRIGLVTTGTELTEQEKVLARYSLIVKDTATQHGNFAATATGLANRQRTLKAVLEDTSATAGKALLPAMRDLAAQFSTFLKDPGTQRSIREFSQDVGRVLPGLLHDLGEALKAAVGILRTLAGVVTTVKDAMGGWHNLLKLLIALKIATVVSGWATSIGLFSTNLGTATGEGALGRATKFRGVMRSLAKIGIITIAVSLLLDERLLDKVLEVIHNEQNGGRSPVPGQTPQHPDERAPVRLTQRRRKQLQGEQRRIPKLRELVAMMKTKRNKGFSWEEIFGLPEVQRALDDNELIVSNARLIVEDQEAREPKVRARRTTARRAASARRGSGGGSVGSQKGLGNATFSSGVTPPKAHVIAFVRRVAFLYGGALNVFSGVRPGATVKGSGGKASQHGSGDAADIGPYGGATLTRIGQCALMAAGMNPAQASKETGGAYNVNGVNVIFNSMVGGDHYDHCHVGLSSLPAGFNKGGTSTTVAPGSDIPVPDKPRSDPKKKKTKKGVGASDLLPVGIREIIAEAGLTKKAGDDISAYNRALAFLTGLLRKTKRGTEKRVEVLNEIAGVKDKLRSLRDKPTKDSPLVPVDLRTTLTKAEGTKGLQDDLKALLAIREQLTKALSGAKKGEKRLEILQELNQVRDRIKGIRDDLKAAGAAASEFQQELAGTRAEAREALAVAKTLPKGTKVDVRDEFGRITDVVDITKVVANIARINKALKTAGNEKVRAQLKADLDKWKGILFDAFDVVRSEGEKLSDILGRAFDKVAGSMLDAFDDVTEGLLGSLNAQFDALTPAEQELLGISGKQRGRERTDLVAARDKAFARLQRTNERNRKKAQRAFDEADEALRQFDLEPIAENERKARETQRDVAVREMQKTRSALRVVLEEQLEDARKLFLEGGKTAGNAFAQGLLEAFPAFKAAFQPYIDWLAANGFTAGQTPRTSGGGGRAIAEAGGTALTGGGRTFAAQAPVTNVVNVGTVIGTSLEQATNEIYEGLLRKQRRNVGTLFE